MLLISKDVGWEDKLKALRTLDIKAQVKAGLLADFLWFAHGKSVGVELKMGGDLLSSISDKRLVVQAKRMVEKIDFPILLIVATLGIEKATGKLVLNGHPTNWDYRSVMGMLADIGMMGMFIEVWAGPAVERVAAWHINTQKEDHAWLQSRSRPQLFTLGEQHNNAVWSLCAWKDIGPTIAKELLKKYGSAAMVYEAARRESPAVLAKGVKGLGKVKAELFLEEVNS